MDNDHYDAVGVLRIPFRHLETPLEFNSAEWADLGEMLAEAKRQLDQFQPEGVTIGWNVEATGSQHISHAHEHVVCRYEKIQGLVAESASFYGDTDYCHRRDGQLREPSCS
ncbi:HIT domain-containing protein [Agrobacterium genomosp. 3 str. CIP 111-78]|uniref:HIT domain-containing protein n=1 Tax=Agrobacterium tumefaciens TaxID=358 RepID=A0AAE6ENK8_AGRTU|nr:MULTISPECIES: HIT domain-containing protein [Rhizobium/Agrobacterium group]MCA2372804.1 HIT domain-containing protein [Agrobacterium tomkonis CIP 111-78]QCM03785.1 HIT domain-containing protein [Agrobacterium tumefaciens]